MKSLIFSLLFISLSGSLYTQSFNNNNLKHYSNIADEIITSSLNDTVGYNLARYLCKNIGSRLSGSENSLKAIKWAEKTLIDMNPDTVWLQPVMVPRWIRGNVEKAVLLNNNLEKTLNVAALGRSIATPEEGINAGVIEVNSFEELIERKNEAKGKIVFFNYRFKNSFVETFNGYGDAVKFRVDGPIEASKAGAVAVITRSITTKYDNVPHVGTIRTFPDSVKEIPAAAIGLIDADFLSKSLKENPGLTINLKLSSRNLKDVLSYNVIAEIKGTEKPDEIIVVGSHFDSWDKGEGAHDDGAPSVQVMEVIDIFKRLNIKPKRTIRCVLFINEENGLRGALKYAEYIDSLKENNIAAIESDRGAFTPRGFTVEADSAVISKMQKWMPVLEKSLIDWVKPGHGGADIGQIKNAKALIGFVPDAQRYFDVHHSDNDVFEEINAREMELGSAAIAILAYLISEEGL